MPTFFTPKFQADFYLCFSAYIIVEMGNINDLKKISTSLSKINSEKFKIEIVR